MPIKDQSIVDNQMRIRQVYARLSNQFVTGMAMTEAEVSSLIAATSALIALRGNDDSYRLDFVPNLPVDVPESTMEITYQVGALIETARQQGWIITVDHVPQLPLAMGNYEAYVNVRPSNAVYRKG